VATANILLRRTLAGEFVVTNKYLMQDHIDMGKWNIGLKDDMVFHGGSVQALKVEYKLGDHPNEPYVLQGSCRLVYTLHRTGAFHWPADDAAGHRSGRRGGADLLRVGRPPACCGACCERRFDGTRP
jgi:hypothetical protein